MKKKKNPILIKVNPKAEEAEKLWEKAKALQKNLTRKEFDEALRQFRNQHGVFPKAMKKVDIPGLDPKQKIMIEIGKVGKLFYEPDKHSEKSPYIYEHATTKEALATDPSGEILILYGNTKMSNSFPTKGWLVR